ncbi:ectoine synthase [Ectothiorhodospiraceae bacterium BW-2]|nr:ectoine synthase [Ectothiorhodospiraceae bacterium BW-2]
MIVRTLDDMKGTEREVHADSGNWVSRRFVIDSDRAGFSFHETIIKAGTKTPIWYKNHIEAVYCVAGDGEIEDLASGEIHPIRDGTLYLLNNHDRHILRGGSEDMRLICAFNPPVTGHEKHDADGAYSAHPQHEAWQKLRRGA